jgi:hypothetical protein
MRAAKQRGEFGRPQPRPLRDGVDSVFPGQFGEHGNRQDAGKRIANAAAMAVVGQVGEPLIERIYIEEQRFVGH